VLRIEGALDAPTIESVCQSQKELHGYRDC